jgi:hypothetical protein
VGVEVGEHFFQQRERERKSVRGKRVVTLTLSPTHRSRSSFPAHAVVIEELIQNPIHVS